MTKNTGIVLGVIGALIVVTGIVFIVTKSTYQTSPSTVTVTDNSTPVQGNNSGSDSSDNSGTAAAQKAGAPIAVTNATVYPTDTTAILTGMVTPNGAFTNYWYEYSTTQNLGSRSADQLLGSGYYNLSAPAYITGLTKNTTYYFRLVAQNQFDKSQGTIYSFRTTSGVSAPEGSAPTVRTVSVSDISDTGATLNGEVTPNKADTKFWFEYGQNADMGNSTIAASTGVGSTKLSKSVVIGNLAANTTYYYRINAQNQFGTVNGSVQTFKTAGPSTSAPSAKTNDATSIKTTSAQLNGVLSANGKITTYWFEYSTDSQFSAALLSRTDQLTIGTDAKNVVVKSTAENLKSKTTYYFRLVSENEIGTVKGDRQSFKTK
ncbi:MAG: hypothetical protein JWP09_721 [Candidatus Taylorbacteria bacterium]|nr:hypothetical protein [Candidatus Taylorbacteria bacterium]